MGELAQWKTLQHHRASFEFTLNNLVAIEKAHQP